MFIYLLLTHECLTVCTCHCLRMCVGTFSRDAHTHTQRWHIWSSLLQLHTAMRFCICLCAATPHRYERAAHAHWEILKNCHNAASFRFLMQPNLSLSASVSVCEWVYVCVCVCVRMFAARGVYLCSLWRTRSRLVPLRFLVASLTWLHTSLIFGAAKLICKSVFISLQFSREFRFIRKPRTALEARDFTFAN